MPYKVIILGATGSLGRHLVRQALQAGHAISVAIRNQSRLEADIKNAIQIHQVDISNTTLEDLANIIRGHDVLINTAGNVADKEAFPQLVDKLVSSIEISSPQERPVSWFLAGAALLDIDSNGGKGVDLPMLGNMYASHLVNFERIRKTDLDWRILCPGPMVDTKAVGIERMRVSLNILPTKMISGNLPSALALMQFAAQTQEITVPYADAANLILDHLSPNDAMYRQRVGLALPEGMRRKK